ATAETFGVSRSAVGRHKLNHLSVQTITDEPASAGREPLRIVDVHQSLTALADRLEKAIEQAARTRKGTMAVTAAREMRQTLMAIAETQSTEELRRAASKAAFEEWATELAGNAWIEMIDRVISAVGGEYYGGAQFDNPRSEVISDLI